jgi:hypothetical protein
MIEVVTVSAIRDEEIVCGNLNVPALEYIKKPSSSAVTLKET